MLNQVQIGRYIPKGMEPCLILAKTSDLYAVALDGVHNSGKCCIACRAELFIRYFLNPENEDITEENMNKLFPGIPWEISMSQLQGLLLPPTVDDIPDPLWETDDSANDAKFSRNLERAVRKKLVWLFQSDGFIPVYDENSKDAFFLPFRFTDGECGIFDNNGIRIDGWNEYYAVLFPGNTGRKCVVSYCQDKNFPPLKGPSMMLPVWLAHLRKIGKLPQYNQFRLISSGEIKNNELVPVEIREKLEGLEPRFGKSAYLFFPEPSKEFNEEKQAVVLPCSITLDNLQEEMEKHLLEKHLFIPSFKEARQWLDVLEKEVRYEQAASKWNSILERLHTLKSACSEKRPEEYLLALILESSVYSHQGRADDALETNKQALDFAKKHGLERSCLRLEIEELVDLTDKSRFDQILALSESLEERVKSSEDEDLLMRYYGTMGQALSYGSLIRNDQVWQEKALGYFREALRFAEKTKSVPDIAQDLNYYYLWHALFVPGSPDAEKAYQEAFQYIEREMSEYPKSRKSNRSFLKRFHAMEFYRNLLKKNEVPKIKLDELRQSTDSGCWLIGLTEKYLGALAAANNDTHSAKDHFKKAKEKLSSPYDRDLLFTVFAESFHSLNDDNDREEALEILEDIPDFPNSDIWKHYLNNPEREEYPAWRYWY